MPEDREAWLTRRASEKASEKAAKRSAWQERHDAELEARRIARSAEREEAREAHRDRLVAIADTFEQQMADNLGISIDEFRALQEDRRTHAQGKPRIAYSPDHVVR